MQVKEDIARLARGTTTVASMSVASRNDCSLAASVSSHGAGVPMSNRIQPCPSSVDASLPTPPQEREGKQAKARGGVGVGVSPKSGKWAVRSSRGAAGAEELGQGGRTDWCRDSLGRFVVEDGLGRMVRASGGSEQVCRGGESTGGVSVSGSVPEIDEDRDRGCAVAVAAAPAGDTDAGEQQGRTTYSNLSGAPKPPPFQRAMSSESADASFRRVASLSRHITGAPPYAYTGRQREVAFKVCLGDVLPPLARYGWIYPHSVLTCRPQASALCTRTARCGWAGAEPVALCVAPARFCAVGLLVACLAA